MLNFFIGMIFGIILGAVVVALITVSGNCAKAEDSYYRRVKEDLKDIKDEGTMNEYIIIGDTDEYKDCLVCLCGTSLKHAENVLYRMLNNPTENDKKLMERHRNFRIKEVADKDCWWRDNCD